MEAVALRPAAADDFEFLFQLHKQTLGPYVDQVWGWHDDVYVGLIEIFPSHQGRGVGSHLVRSVLDDAFARGKGVRLHVLAVNADAYRLYRRLGFSEVSRERTAPEVRIQMRARPASSTAPMCSGGT